jgi:hypothetical protein
VDGIALGGWSGTGAGIGSRVLVSDRRSTNRPTQGGEQNDEKAHRTASNGSYQGDVPQYVNRHVVARTGPRAFVYQDETVSGNRSNFNKLVSRAMIEERARR